MRKTGKTLVDLLNVSIRRSRHASRPAVQGLTCRIEPEDTWVLTGPLGSGKTTILEAIRGEIPVERSGSLTHPFLEEKVWPSDVIKLLDSRVAATGDSAYYSERYHARRENDSTLRTWLGHGLHRASETFGVQEGVGDDPAGVAREIDRVAEELDLVDLLDSSTINLSNGQSKRATIARLLLSRPRVLLLDEIFVGLDVAARAKLIETIGDMTRLGRPKVILALRPLDEVPPWATHMLWMNQDGTQRYAGPIKDISKTYEDELRAKRAQVVRDRRSRESSLSSDLMPVSGEVLVALEDVRVSYWGKEVLRGVDWSIRRGERWLLSGSNGSGKTTLLALILGDHPKIYANKVTLFGQRRTTRDRRSVFEIQRQMGHSSPEIHKHYPRYLTLLQCLESGFTDSFLPPPPRSTTDRDDRLDLHRRNSIREILSFFHYEQDSQEELLQRPLSQVDPATQRLFLLMRALVKKPALLILDEPFAAMNESMIVRAKEYLNTQLTRDQALIFISHYEDEVPSCVTQELRLHRGSVVSTT